MNSTAVQKRIKESKWRAFWRSKRHNQIYFFSAATLALIIAFTFNLASISMIYNRDVSVRYANTTVFTPVTKTSLSGVTIQVMLCRVNQAHDRMFILLKMADITDVSLDITNYELLVTNADKNMKRASKSVGNLKGQYYVFGATGYAGIYIYSDQGAFGDDYKWITVRNYKPVTNNRKPYISLVAEDSQYDQYHVFVNPRSLSAQTIDFLENTPIGEPLVSTQIYMEAISEHLETEIKANIVEASTELEDTRMRISEYRRRLADDYNLVVPEVASIMSGDTIESVEILDEYGNVTGTKRQFNFAAVVPCGVNLDWRELNLRSGYYRSFYESNIYSLSEFISQLKSTEKTSYKITVYPSDWTFTDGSPIDVSSKDMKPIVDEINNYNGYLEKYIALKTRIQADLFVSLLELEYSTNTYMSSARVLTDVTAENGEVIPALLEW